MTIKELSCYYSLVARLSRAEELLESLEEASLPGSIPIDGMPQSTEVKNRVGDLIVEIEDLIERIKYLKREIKREKKKLEKFIDRIHDERIRMAFRLKYIHGLTWAHTADILGNKAETIKKLCYKYIEKIEMNDKEIECD